MEMFLWILGVHLIELIGIGIFFLIKKNSNLEKVVNQQQQHIENLDFITSQLISNLSKIDERAHVEGDAELEEIFRNTVELRELLKTISDK
jgi:hypothetical protein